jgi:hypothetical protein
MRTPVGTLIMIAPTPAAGCEASGYLPSLVCESANPQNTPPRWRLMSEYSRAYCQPVRPETWAVSAARPSPGNNRTSRRAVLFLIVRYWARQRVSRLG